MAMIFCMLLTQPGLCVARFHFRSTSEHLFLPWAELVTTRRQIAAAMAHESERITKELEKVSKTLPPQSISFLVRPLTIEKHTCISNAPSSPPPAYFPRIKIIDEGGVEEVAPFNSAQEHPMSSLTTKRTKSADKPSKTKRPANFCSHAVFTLSLIVINIARVIYYVLNFNDDLHRHMGMFVFWVLFAALVHGFNVCDVFGVLDWCVYGRRKRDVESG